MPRRATFASCLLLAAVGAAGCGSGGVQLANFEAPEVYLPPMASDVAPAAPSSLPSPALEPESATETAAPQPAGAPSDAEVAAELKEAFKGGGKNAGDAATVGNDGLATVPLTAPQKVRAMILAGNQVATKPYVYGGGHGGGPEGTFTDSAYDCSGSVSYSLASAGFIDTPMASGPLETFGKSGPGKWVSIYANAGHAFMVVAGLRFDTSGRSEGGTRWQANARSVGGFTVRHPPGL